MTQISQGRRPAAPPGERVPFEPAESGEAPGTAGDKAVTGFSHTVLIIWSVLVILPLIWVLMSSFKTSSEIFASPFALPQRWSFDNYVNAWTTAGIGSFFFNSVIVVVRRADSHHVVRLDVGLRAGSVQLPWQPGAVLPDARRAHFPDLPGDRAVVLRAARDRSAQYVARPDLDLRGVRVPVHCVLPLCILPVAVKIDRGGGRGGRCGGVADLLPDHAADGQAGSGYRRDLELCGLWNQFLLPIALNTNPDNYVLTQAMASFASQAGYSVDFGALFAAVVITVVPVLIIYLIFQRQLQGSVSAGVSK